MSMQIAVQLYTLRDQTEKDFVGTLEKVAEIGYKGVEFAGYGNMSATSLKSLLDRLELKPVGSHIGIEDLLTNLSEVISYNLEIGNKNIVCPYDKFETLSELTEKAFIYNRIGEKCKKNGLQFCYHNHSHEFKEINGVSSLDWLFQSTDHDLVKAEIDTYWVQFAGRDPVSLLKEYGDRVVLIHQKDMDNTEKKGITEVGNGIMEIKKIAACCSVQWCIVEQDICQKPSLESVTISLNNLKKMGLA